MADLALKVDGIAKIAGRRHILRDVSFFAGSGELIAVLGRNGAGKTTLLSVLAGRLNPDRGLVSLEIGGRPLKGADFRRAVAILPHDLLIYPDLTARENLKFFMTLTGKKPDADVIFATLNTIGLAKDADRVVRLFSRGMQQRVAIGRLLVLQSNVWILDEPTTGLDEAGRRWLLDLLKAQTAAGKLILMSSHHQGEVSAVASRILLLDSGRVRLDGPAGPQGATAAFAIMDEGAA